MTDTNTTPGKLEVIAREVQRGPQGPDVLRISDVLELLRITRPTFNQLRSTGGFPPPFYVGSHPRWRRSAVEEWMDQGGSSQ